MFFYESSDVIWSAELFKSSGSVSAKVQKNKKCHILRNRNQVLELCSVNDQTFDPVTIWSQRKETNYFAVLRK